MSNQTPDGEPTPTTTTEQDEVSQDVPAGPPANDSQQHDFEAGLYAGRQLACYAELPY